MIISFWTVLQVSLHYQRVFFTTADIVLVPTIPTTLSLRTYQQIMAFFEQQGIDQSKVLLFFVMVDRRKKMHRLILEHPPSFMSSLLKSYIPYASEVERMGVHRAPLTVFAARSRAAECYTSMWDELRSLIYALE